MLNKNVDGKNFLSFRQNVLIHPLNEMNLVQNLKNVANVTNFVES